MNHIPTAPSASEIRSLYFGNKVKSDDSRDLELFPQQKVHPLTPTSQYVIKEARKRLATLSSNSLHEPDEEALFQIVREVEEREGEELSEQERHICISALLSSFEHYDILTPLIDNPDINDIIIRSYNDISVQMGRVNVQTDLAFSSEDSYTAFVENLLKRSGKACTTAAPVVDAAVDPHVRACVTHESFSPPGSGPMLTLRISRHTSVTADALIQYELCPRIILNYLGALVASGDTTALIAGEVGTGKTTLIKALTQHIPEEEAILIIEDTHELHIQRRFVRTLLTREANSEGSGRISPAVAIRAGMRMAMNRIILGEMRDSEAAEAFIDVCSSGHAGMSTIHARSARDAINRLELFLSRAQGSVGMATIRRQIANALGVVVFLGLDKRNQHRRILEILEVGTSSDGIVQLSPIFRFSPQFELPTWTREAGVSQFHKLLAENGCSLPQNGHPITLDPESLYHNHARQASEFGLEI